MPELTPATIRSIGKAIRSQHDKTTGNCRTIALSFQTALSEQHDVHTDVVEVRIGERRDTHFVNKLSATDYSDCDAGSILIDCSLDQFCTGNQHLDDVRVDLGPQKVLPNVGIYPPGSEERHLWYYKPNSPLEGQDVFSDNESSS